MHRGEKHLIAVVLGGKTGSQRDAAMRALLEKNFAAASSTKPTAAQLVASLVTPAPLPAMKKPAYAAASVTPAPAAETPVAGPAEGDISEPALPLRASLTSSDPLPKPSARKVQYDGAYHVQVGAYTSQAEAENRLGMVQQRADGPARRPPPLHHLLHEGRQGMVPRPFRRFLEGRRSEPPAPPSRRCRSTAW